MSTVSALSVRTPTMSSALLSPKQRMAFGSTPGTISQARFAESRHLIGASLTLTPSETQRARRPGVSRVGVTDVASHMVGAAVAVVSDASDNLRGTPSPSPRGGVSTPRKMPPWESSTLHKQPSRGRQRDFSSSGFDGGSMLLSPSPRAHVLNRRDTSGLPLVYARTHASHMEGVSMRVSPRGAISEPARSPDMQQEGARLPRRSSVLCRCPQTHSLLRATLPTPRTGARDVPRTCHEVPVCTHELAPPAQSSDGRQQQRRALRCPRPAAHALATCTSYPLIG